jgi:hypothetical protein
VPIKIVSEANNFDYWRRKNKRKKKNNEDLKYHLNVYTPPKLPCLIKLTRISPRKLDYDNLVFSQKYILDTICDFLLPGLKAGRADGDSRITVEYHQEKRKPKEFGLQVEIFSL